MCFARNAFQNNAFQLCPEPGPSGQAVSNGGMYNPYHLRFVRAWEAEQRKKKRQTAKAESSDEVARSMLEVLAEEGFAEVAEKMARHLIPKSKTAAKMGAELDEPVTDAKRAAADMGAVIEDED